MFLYRLLITLLAPGLAGLLLWRLIRGRETPRDLNQRLGGGPGELGAIWLHGASNGELTSARKLVDALRAEYPDRALVITANTTTGRDLVRGWGLARVSARLAPLDYRWALSRFRARWQPSALIVLENELWPNRIVTAKGPVLVVAARMSDRSAARWARWPGPLQAVLGRIDWLSAQDTGSADRFKALGFDPARLGPPTRLKEMVTLSAPPAAELADLARIFTRADTVLAASTHDGEDAIILQGFAAARAANPALKLILAPRHPRRSADIAALVRYQDLPLAIRSKSERPDAGTVVYLVDTIGEMPLWYALTGICVVGGSMVDHGGHTPFEPTQASSAVVHGPHVANFAAIYAELDQHNGAICVRDVVELRQALEKLGTPAAQTRLAKKARQVLDASTGDRSAIDRIVTVLRHTEAARHPG